MTKATSERKVKAGIVQMQMSDDPEANMAKALDMTADAIAQGAQVICLPELFRSRYFSKAKMTQTMHWPRKFPAPVRILLPHSRASTTLP